MADPVELIKLLSDATRLRLLALLQTEPLSVVELQGIMDMGQSRISSHLALLRQAGLVDDRREGKKSFYSSTPPNEPVLRRLYDCALEAAAKQPEFEEDALNLDRVLSRRRAESEAYFNMVAGKLGKNYCPGRSWEAIGHFLLLLTPKIDVVDLGAGEGVLSQLLARKARSVICIDNSPAMVKVGTELAREHGIDNLSYKLGDIESVPLPDNSVDLALLSQALHHARKPEEAIAEAWRILRPGGQLVVLDLNQHTFEKARELYADRWLGFPPNRLYHWIKSCGFESVSVDPVSKEPKEPCFETLLATGLKPR
ncbi:metalloregulator ArsR/SmtB family transcription factor [Puniceicoccales bacterium CK1056]|uniref:Metalloregulator ArsR/SmtB family transcription factor n=1 Tax=Oceanipulchritudo coccoides TaxID=2706888 RepID=A0A6B2M0T7_9BACT|nr:metalloregulator ArsR/SmtB family transcription factor [Oceanipulchritudo coccoides]NDV61395.1 metalloregulator ArsR/SmtB family transcription factor [Oceanipulchritudo coccoides]